MAEEVLFKVIIIGDPTVGKTSFVHRYVNNSFRRDYKMTIGVDFALKVIRWSDHCNIKLQLWDIAGQERFTSMTRVYYKDAHACIIMFDMTQKPTYQNAVRWKKDLDSKCQLADGSAVPCLLLANKVLNYRVLLVCVCIPLPKRGHPSQFSMGFTSRQWASSPSGYKASQQTLYWKLWNKQKSAQPGRAPTKSVLHLMRFRTC